MGSLIFARLVDRHLAVGALLILLLSFRAGGQVCRSSELRVLVRDSQESPIYDAQVRLVSVSAEAGIRTTPPSGVVGFEDIPCGSWTVRASKTGFEDSVVTVQIGNDPFVETILALNPQIAHSSVDVTATSPQVEERSSQDYEMRPAEIKTLPSGPTTVSEALPLVPGVVRAPNADLKIDGAGEQRSSLVVNQSDVTDPSTGRFGQTVPIDSLETVNVLTTPFLAQYGRSTQNVVAVETRRGGDKWHADLSQPFPDFRVRSRSPMGIRKETPRSVLGGPVIQNRLYFITALQYYLNKSQGRSLGFPQNVSKNERVNSFTQVDFIASSRQIVNFTYHFSPEHINFVNPGYFNPQPVTPSYAQRNYVATLADHLGIFGGTLDTSASMQRFHTFIGAQGDGGMVMTPQGNLSNYFGAQSRDAWRREWLEIWSPAPWRLLGTHQWKLGTSLTASNDRGSFTFRPVEILGAQSQLLERIDFVNQGPYKRTDLEFTGYAQDHWSPSPRISFDYGVRVEHQRLASNLRYAPRMGVAWTPPDGKTVFRAGYGQFYDHIPLDVYTFSRYPVRTVTDYAPDGSIAGVPLQYMNVIGDATGPRSFLVNGNRVAGAFSPRGATWNLQVEHSFSSLLQVRAVYTDNRSVGLIVFEPDRLGTTDEIVLNGNGSSRYRQAELTAKIAWSGGQNLVVSYIHSRAEGSLNVFDNYLGNYAQPVIHPDVYGNLPGDLPNRFLARGRVNAPFWNIKLIPVVEWRTGFPYVVYDQFQNYVGAPNSDSTRLPSFISADVRIMRDFRVSPKYTVRLSITGANLTNHFNALAIHDNIADPQYRLFFANYKRRYGFDLEIIL